MTFVCSCVYACISSFLSVFNMALVLIMGAPCCGKTKRANELAKHLREVIERERIANPAANQSSPKNNQSKPKRFTEVSIVNYESVGLLRSAMFATNVSESSGRSKLFSAAERELASSRCVIADWNHTAKSGRYELWCRARSLGLVYAVIHVTETKEQAIEWNAARDGDRYTDAQMADLYGRMEWPKAANRWDSPLITVDANEPMPFDAIDAAVLSDGSQRLRPGMATASTLEPTTFDAQLLSVCTEVVNAILSAQQSHRVALGDAMPLPHTSVKLILHRNIHAHELKRVQTQFISMAKRTNLSGQDNIATSFTQLIQRTLERDDI